MQVVRIHQGGILRFEEAPDPYLQQLSLLGTTMGSPRDFAELLVMLEDGAWHPVVDPVFPLGEIEAAHGRMEGSDHFGKVVPACS